MLGFGALKKVLRARRGGIQPPPSPSRGCIPRLCLQAEKWGRRLCPVLEGVGSGSGLLSLRLHTCSGSTLAPAPHLLRLLRSVRLRTCSGSYAPSGSTLAPALTLRPAPHLLRLYAHTGSGSSYTKLILSSPHWLAHTPHILRLRISYTKLDPQQHTLGSPLGFSNST